MHVKLAPQYKNSCYIICFLIVLIAKFAIRKYSAHDKRQAKIYPQFRSIIPCEVLLYIEVTFLGFIH